MAHLQPLLNVKGDNLLEGRVIHCDEICVHVLKDEVHEPNSQSLIWVQKGGIPAHPDVLSIMHPVVGGLACAPA